MRFSRCSFAVFGALLAGPAAAQVFIIPPGAYRTAAAYRRRLPRPGGLDAFYPDKRGQLVVVAPRGATTVKLRVAPDSVWGFVTNKGRTRRIYRGIEYQLEAADTLAIYTSSDANAGAAAVGPGIATPGSTGLGNLANTRYYFSRGLTGLIFPLTPRYLREAYAASNPAFVAALNELRFDQSLNDFDRKTGLFRVTTVYRQAAGR